MKKSSLLFLFVFICSTLAQAQDLFGEFKFSHKISFPQVSDMPLFLSHPVQYADAAECHKDKGTWVNGHGANVCQFQTEDVVTVKRFKDHAKLEISKIGDDARSCSFDAPVTFISTTQLTASDESCTIIVNYSDTTDTVAVTSTEGCHEFCGQGLDMNIRSAARSH